MAQRMASGNSSLPEPQGYPVRGPQGLGLGMILAGIWLAVTLVVMVVGFRQAIFIAPTEATMGNVQRIFYYHVPHAIWALLFPYVNLIGSVAFLYLRRRNPLAALSADALAVAAAEVTVVYASVGLVTGMLWGRAAWGIWWTWDARLTTFLLLWLLYVAYLMTRRLSNTGQTSTLGAVLAVFAAIDVPDRLFFYPMVADAASIAGAYGRWRARSAYEDGVSMEPARLGDVGRLPGGSAVRSGAAAAACGAGGNPAVAGGDDAERGFERLGYESGRGGEQCILMS